MKKGKIFGLIIISILTVTTVVLGVLAVSEINSTPISEIPEAIKAADVCAEHLVHDCSECEGNEDTSYAVYCPHCGALTTRCCSGDCAVDDYEANCYVSGHPSSCKTIQDLYWNAYICMDCGWYTIGTHSDDYHVEAYWHKNDPSCCNDCYCGLDDLDDLREIVNGRNADNGLSDAESASGSTDCQSEGQAACQSEITDNTSDIDEAILAGDYCEIHGIFGCDIPHNDVN